MWFSSGIWDSGSAHSLASPEGPTWWRAGWGQSRCEQMADMLITFRAAGLSKQREAGMGVLQTFRHPWRALGQSRWAFHCAPGSKPEHQASWHRPSPKNSPTPADPGMWASRARWAEELRTCWDCLFWVDCDHNWKHLRSNIILKGNTPPRELPSHLQVSKIVFWL